MFTEPFVLLDTEYTANEHSKARNWEGEYKEIIQIGAIGVFADFTQVWTFEAKVRPVLNPHLSPFIMRLTGITQEEVDVALTLEHVLFPFASRIGDVPIYCYGEDGAVIEENCRLRGFRNPLPAHQFRNLKKMLEPTLIDLYIDPDRFSSGTLIRLFGKEGKRAHHALHDVENLLIVLRELRAQRRL